MGGIPAEQLTREPVAPSPLSPRDFDRASTLRPRPGRDAGATLKRLISGFWRALRHDLKRMLIATLIGGAIGYGANVAVIAITSHGGATVPVGSPATAPGSQVTGSIFWSLAMAMLLALVSFRLNVGGKIFWQGVRNLPATPVRLLRADGRGALTHLLWGLAGMMLAAAFINPALSGVFAVGAGLVVVGVLRSIVTGIAIALWRALFGKISRRSGNAPGESGVSVSMLGAVVALIVAIFVPAVNVKLIIALVAAALALLLSIRKIRVGSPATARHATGLPLTVAAVSAICTAALLALLPLIALASPPCPTPAGCTVYTGKAQYIPGAIWIDCGSNSTFAAGIVPFSPGGQCAATASKTTPPPPINPFAAGVFGGLFGLLGSLLGYGLGPGLSAAQLQEIARRKQMQEWRQQHPCSPWDDYWASVGATNPNVPNPYESDEMRAYKDGAQLLNDMADQVHLDISTGEAQQRIVTMLHDAPEGAWHGLQGMFSMMQQYQQDTKDYGLFLGPAKYGFDQAASLVAAVPGLPDKINEVSAALASHDTQVSGHVMAELLGQAEFMAVLGRATGAVLSAGGTPVPNFPGSVPGQAALMYAADGTAVAADGVAPLGWRPDQVTAAAQIAADYDGVYVAKPGQPSAIAAQVDNPLAKPQGLPAQSSQPLDSTIGMGGAGKDGFVMYGLPEPPTPPPGLSGDNLASWEQAANDQYAKRLGSYMDNSAAMNKAQTKGIPFNIGGQEINMTVDWTGGGKWTNPVTGAVQNFGDGVVYSIVPEDAPAWAQKVLGPPGTKVPVTGDNDGFAFVSNQRITPTGGILPLSSFPAAQAAAIEAQEARAVAAAQNGGIPGVVHEGNTPNWNPPTPQKAAVKQCIMSGFSADNPAAQNLIWVDGQGSVTVGRWPGYEAPPSTPPPPTAPPDPVAPVSANPPPPPPPSAPPTDGSQ